MTSKKPQVPPKSFEDAQNELEQILSEMERGEVGLEESLSKYERGVFLIEYCRTRLSSAEKQIEQLSRNENGTISASPMPNPNDSDE